VKRRNEDMENKGASWISVSSQQAVYLFEATNITFTPLG